MLVQDLHSNRQEVLKIFRPELDRNMYKLEAELVLSFSHPRILSATKFFTQVALPQPDETNSVGQKLSTKHFSVLALEYAPKGDLLGLLETLGHLPEIVARTYFHQLVDAVEYIHSKEICHLDIKPDNVLLDENLCLKLSDFGIALKVSKQSFLKGAAGSQLYFAPEMHQNLQYNAYQADLFALGVTLFTMVGGNIPFDAAKTTDVVYKWLIEQKFDEFWSFHEKLKNRKERFYSESFRDLIQRMLAYDGRKRLSIEKLKTHPWYNGLTLPENKLGPYIASLLNKSNKSA
mgnify:FL=1